MKKLRVNPKEIHLADIPEEGRTYSYTRESGELNVALKDVVGQNDYKIDLEIRPLGNVYELRGKISAQMDLACSRCGIDFKFPVNQSFQEVVVIEEEMPRSGKTARVNHTTELDACGPDYMILSSDVFKVTEFMHELIALAEPIQPLGKADCDKGCENLNEVYEKGLIQPPGSEPVASGTHNPFTVLKDMKLNS